MADATQTETVNAAAASSLVFGQQPANTTAWATIAPPVTVQIVDQYGNLTNSTIPIDIRIDYNAYGVATLYGTKSVNAVNGVATFSNLSIDDPANGYTLAAWTNYVPGSEVVSAPFNILSAKLAFMTTPQNLTAGIVSGVITVQLQDASSNPITAGTNVTVFLSSTSGTGQFSASSSGTPTTTSVTIPSGNNTVSFYYKDTKAGTPTITAATSGPTKGTQTETVSPASVNVLALDGQCQPHVGGGGRHQPVNHHRHPQGRVRQPGQRQDRLPGSQCRQFNDHSGERHYGCQWPGDLHRVGHRGRGGHLHGDRHL